MSGEFLLAVAALVAGITVLRSVWRRRAPLKLFAVMSGWLLVCLGFGILIHDMGGELGVFYALLALSLIGYGIVLASVELRSTSHRAARELALEPEERSTNWTRGIAKSLLAIVLSGIAAIGVGVAVAVAAPMATHDRIMIGGILVPVLWGAGMAWTLSDAKLLRATIVLVLTSALGYGIAFLPKAFS